MSIDVELLLEKKIFSYSPEAIKRSSGANEDYHFIIIGAGGTGGYLIPNLGRMVGIKNKEGSEHTVTIIDADNVEEKNLLRQNFSPNDINKNKAEVMATRYGRAFGETFYYLDEYIETAEQVVSVIKQEKKTTVIIDCVDNNKTRFILKEGVRQYHEEIDFNGNNTIMISSGNEEHAGQVIFSYQIGRYSDYYENEEGNFLRVESPDLIDIFPNMEIGLLPDEESCAERAVSAPQNIATNMTAADIIFGYVNKLLNNIDVDTLVYFFDSRTMMRKSYSGRATHVKELLKLVEGNEKLSAFFYSDEQWPKGTKKVSAPTYEEVLSSSNQVEDIIERASELEEEASVFVEEIDQNVSTVVPQESSWTEAPEDVAPLRVDAEQQVHAEFRPSVEQEEDTGNVVYESNFRLYSTEEINVVFQESELSTLLFDGHPIIVGIPSRIDYRIDIEQAIVVVHTTERIGEHLTPEGQDRFIETFIIEQPGEDVYEGEEVVSVTESIFEERLDSQESISPEEEYHVYLSVVDLPEISIQEHSVDGISCSSMTFDDELIIENIPGEINYYSEEPRGEIKFVATSDINQYLTTAGEDILITENEESGSPQAPTIYYDGVNYTRREMYDFLLQEISILRYTNPEEDEWSIAQAIVRDFIDYLNDLGLNYEYDSFELYDIFNEEHESIMDHLENLSPAGTAEQEEPTFYYNNVEYTLHNFEVTINDAFTDWSNELLAPAERQAASFILSDLMEYLDGTDVIESTTLGDFYAEWENDPTPVLNYMQAMESSSIFYYNRDFYTKREFVQYVNSLIENYGTRDTSSFGFMLTVDNLEGLINTLNRYNILATQPIVDFIEDWDNNYNEIINQLFDTPPPINVNWREDTEEDEEEVSAPVAEEPIQESLFSMIEDDENGEYTLPFDIAEMIGGLKETLHFSLEESPDIRTTANLGDAMYTLEGEKLFPDNTNSLFIDGLAYIEDTQHNVYYKISDCGSVLSVYSNGIISESMTEDGLNHCIKKTINNDPTKTIYFEGQEYTKEEMSIFIDRKVQVVSSPHSVNAYHVGSAIDTLKTLVLHFSRIEHNLILTTKDFITIWDISPEYILTKLEEVLPITSSENIERASNPIAVIIRASIEDFEERNDALYYTGRWLVQGPIDNYMLKELNDGKVMITATTSTSLHPDNTRFRVLFNENELSFLEAPTN